MKTLVRYTIMALAVAFMLTFVLGGHEVFGQTATYELGVPQFFDANGNPLNAGKLYSYLAGSSTASALYTNRTLTVAYTDPIVLNSAGRPAGPIYVQNLAYKFELYTSANVLVWSADYQYPASMLAGSWTYNGINNLHPNNTNSDVLIGNLTDALVAADVIGHLNIVGTSMRVLSDATANSNYLNVRATGGAITFEGLLNGTATAIPMHWRDGCSSPCMTLDASTGTDILTVGTSATPGKLVMSSSGSSSTYDAQGVTSNSVITTSGYFGTATAADTLLGSRLPFYLKQPSGTFAVFNDSAGSSGSVVFITTSTSGKITSGSTGIELSLHNNATGNSPIITMGAYTAATIAGLGGGGGPGFALTDATLGVIFLADSTANAATTGLMIWHNGSLQRVGLSAADSCSAGFRCLRVLN